MTPTRRFVLLLSLGLAPALLAAWWTPLLYAALVYDAAVFLLMVLEWGLGATPEKLAIERTIPGKLNVGIANPYALTLKSYSAARMRLKIVDGWPAEFSVSPETTEVELKPYEQKRLALSVVPGGRGEFALAPAHARATVGLGLVARTLAFGKAESVRVYPNLKELRRYDLLSRRRLLKHHGFRSVRRLGEGREFERLREYTPGDDFRVIDWKATARRGRPITRLYETERGQNVVVAVDAGRLMAAASGSMTKLDHAINAALMLGYVALRSHDRVGLVVFSSEVERVMLPRAGRGALARMMETLVPLQPRITSSNYRGMVETLAQRLRRRSLIVLFTDLADPQSAREIVKYLPLLRRAHIPVCVAFKDPGLTELASKPAEDALFEHAAALELQRDWRHTLGELHTGGVGIVDVHPEEAAVAAVNKYLELKKRQLI